MKKETKVEVRWTLLNHDGWSLHLAATAAGLCYVGSQGMPWEEMAQWVNRRIPESVLVQDDQGMQRYANALAEYLSGERDRFSMPLDVRGTPFQLAVWEALGGIPYGQTRTYSDIAALVEKPSAVRAVGTAIGANPVLIAVPCHRVIGKNGALTGYRGGMEMKETLLRLEQTAARAEGRQQSCLTI